MYRPTELTEMRIDRFVSERLRPAIYRQAAPLTVTIWEAPDEPVPFSEAVAADYTPFEVGRPWGHPWSTAWFHLTGTVPADWTVGDGSIELVVDLGFGQANAGFQAEGLVYRPDGSTIKGLEPFNFAVPVEVGPGGAIDVYVEAASNPDVGAGMRDWLPITVGRKSTAGKEHIYSLRRADVAILDSPVWELDRDIWTLKGLALELPESQPRRAEIIAALDAAVDTVDPEDVSGTAADARAVLAPALAKPANASAHRIFAVGHAHIDSAWLWPVRETIRKCARTFSNVLDLMDRDPEFVFACSSAQQYAWMRDYYPEIFERIRARVADGRFVPVGGMWVESDTNMPSGEALVRQFVEGKRLFIDEFGFEPKDVWLPDSFGYSASMPQIAKAAGSDAFLTQKLSWNEVNVFPHHTFEWEGIDGSRILTHFPPVDTYNSKLSGDELARAERNYAEKGIGNTSLAPFGWGDGGGGPTREMLAAAARTRSLEGSPTVTVDTPANFFEAVRAESPKLGVWAGELYLEFHRGTYTSQARTKKGNRRSEVLLHEAELWATTAAVRAGAEYPYDALQSAWQTVLLQQFHDILPGSSIGWVYDVAEENYERVAGELEGLISGAVGALGGSGASVAFNASPYEVDGVPALGAAATAAAGSVRSSTDEDGSFVLDNGIVRVVVDGSGLIRSLVEAASGREAIPRGTAGNLLQLFRDTPTQWDAWDLDKEYRRVGRDLVEADSVEAVELPDGGVGVRIVRSFGSSTVTQVLGLRPGVPAVEIETEVDWHERKKLLKLAVPVDVHSAAATSEIQFGHLVRATHGNTSWDQARFETVAHKWIHVGDSSFGVAVANDSTYGHDVIRTEADGSGTYSTIRQSLLRAPIYPDPEADQGVHTMRTSIRVGGIPEAVTEGYRLNYPLRQVSGDAVAPLVSSDGAGVVIDTVKLATDRSGDVIVRLYEAHGTRSSATITADFEHSGVTRTDLLERPIGDSETDAVLELSPFEIVTLRFARG